MPSESNQKSFRDKRPRDDEPVSEVEQSDSQPSKIQRKSKWGQTSLSGQTPPEGQVSGGGFSSTSSSADGQAISSIAQAAAAKVASERAWLQTELHRAQAGIAAQTSSSSKFSSPGLPLPSPQPFTPGVHTALSTQQMYLLGAARSDSSSGQLLAAALRSSVANIVAQKAAEAAMASAAQFGPGHPGTVSTAPTTRDPGVIGPGGRGMAIKPSKYSTLKINKRMEQSVADTNTIKLQRINILNRTQAGSLTANPFIDPNLKVGKDVFKKSALRFIDPGFFSELETDQRNHAVADVGTAPSRPPASIVDRYLAQQNGGSRDGMGETDSYSQPSLRPSHSYSDHFGSSERILAADALRSAAVPLQRSRHDAFLTLEPWDIKLTSELTPQEIIKTNELINLASKTEANVSNPPCNIGSEFPFFLPPGKGQNAGDLFPYRILTEHLTKFVEHPPPIAPLAERNAAQIPTVMYLTPKEKERMRKRKRQEKERDKQDKIRIGLLPPPPPKIKLSNLMRVLGEEAVANPSAMERQVRSQVKERLETHLERNLARKLAPEKRAEKKIQKWLQKEDQKVNVHVQVYSISEIKDSRHLFKIQRNAEQLHMTGVGLFGPASGNLVVVEGGPRSAHRYKGLMLRRIKWKGDETNLEEEESDEGNKNTATEDRSKMCTLIWEGTTKDKTFKDWKIVSCADDTEAERYMTNNKAEHLWNMVKRYRDSLVDL